MKKFIIFLSIFFLSPLPVLAHVYITEVMPNTDDDASMEYIEISNTGCQSIDIAGYQIADKEKSYTFAAGSIIGSHEKYRISRTVSKIILNNSNEDLFLRDSGGVLIDDFSYTTSEKGIAIIVPGIVLDDCAIQDPQDDGGEGVDDTADKEDTPEQEEAENTGVGNDVEPRGGDNVNNVGTGGTRDPTDEFTGTGIDNADKNKDIVPPNEDLESPERDDDGDPGGSYTGSDNSPSGQLDGDAKIDTIQISGLLGKSGSLLPQILLYSDSDDDNKIDMLEILYDVYITGSVDISKIFLYSNTGGLYDERINTATGYILDAEIENNILRLFLEPSHFEKKFLTVNTTTQSDIRLKSADGFGIKSLSGGLIGDFFLTTSFDSYKEVYEKGTYESRGVKAIEKIPSNTSGAVSISFPDIIPTIQNYTNTTLSGTTFICRETPCRLNLNFEPIFTTTYPASSFTCQIVYNGVIEDKCNPSQWTITSAGGFDIRITHKSTGQFQSQYFPIHWNIISTSTPVASRVYDNSAPIPRITLNGTLTKKQIQKEDNHILCYTNSCSLNFDGSDTYDPDGSSMVYGWSASGNIFSNKKNPTVQEFGPGEHIVEFTVTDISGKSSKEYFKVSVLGDRESIIEGESKELSDISVVSSKTVKQKRQAMNFFSPPALIVEKSSTGFSLHNSGYRCITTNPSCSINFALTGTIEGIYYRFSYSHDPVPLYSSNPRSRSFQPGKYMLIVSAHYQKDEQSIWQQSIPIEVIRTKKSKVTKASNSKVKTTSTEKPSNNIEIIPTAYADDGRAGSSDSVFVLSFLFLSLILNIFFLTRRKLDNT